MKERNECHVFPLVILERASWKGKDLLEATNQHPKSSLEFKDLLLKQIKAGLNTSLSLKFIKDKIRNFAYLIYGNKERAEIFTEKIMDNIYETLEAHSIEIINNGS